VQDEEGMFTLYWSDLLKVVIIGVEKLVNLIDKLYASKKIDYEEYRDVVKKTGRPIFIAAQHAVSACSISQVLIYQIRVTQVNAVFLDV
jgi:hypothetical protein